LKVALIGLLQSGKSTILAGLSGKAIPPVGSTKIEEAVVSVPDVRLDWLSKLHKPEKTIYAAIDCLDVPGFNFADEHGRAAARRFIDQVRTVDMLALVLGAFENSANTAKDLANLKTELLLADLALVTTRITNLEKQIQKVAKAHAHDKDKAELELQKKLQQAIESEKPISAVIETDEQLEMIKPLGFLTLKPMIVAVNISEKQLDTKFDFTGIIDNSVPVITLCAELEYELSQLDPGSKQEFMADLGITEPEAAKLAHACYRTLELISFITIGSDEVRAWTIKQGTVALDAAGKVHTDIKRGFIRAETFSFDDLKNLGSEKAVKAAGKIRIEGKGYVIQDGDVINFRFNV